jgi:hypothetical protein
MVKTPAGNGRFAKMAGVTPQKVQCNFVSFVPARTIVRPATSASRRALGASGGRHSER